MALLATTRLIFTLEYRDGGLDFSVKWIELKLGSKSAGSLQARRKNGKFKMIIKKKWLFPALLTTYYCCFTFGTLDNILSTFEF